MPYADNYRHADDIVQHLNGIVPVLNDALLQAKYTGFVTVAAVTVYEMAVKDLFIEFARNQNAVFGTFAESIFERINGRIRLEDLRTYACRFGKTHEDDFAARLAEASSDHLAVHKRDLRANYNNLILWRHDFAHAGRINAAATYPEACQAYEDGKLVIKCLAKSMS